MPLFKHIYFPFRNKVVFIGAWSWGKSAGKPATFVSHRKRWTCPSIWRTPQWAFLPSAEIRPTISRGMPVGNGSNLNWEAFILPASVHHSHRCDYGLWCGDCNSSNRKPLFVFLNAALQLKHLTALVSPAACFRAPGASQDCCTWLRFTRWGKPLPRPPCSHSTLVSWLLSLSPPPTFGQNSMTNRIVWMTRATNSCCCYNCSYEALN